MKKKPLFRASVLVLMLSLVFMFSYRSNNQSETNRYIKLDKNGNRIDPWKGPWSCILDNETGLIWENKTDDESIHDALWTFSWYQHGIGIENSGDCYFEAERCDTQDLIKKTNLEKTCGLDGWRLPTEKELMSIVNHKPKTGQAKISNDFFSYTKRGDYWTSNHNIPLLGVYSHLKYGARSIDFIEGKPRDLPYRNAAFLRLLTVKKEIQR